MQIQSESLTAARKKEQNEDWRRRLHFGWRAADNGIAGLQLAVEQIVEDELAEPSFMR